MTDKLTTAEKRKLKTHEETIERGRLSFLEVGHALMCIQQEDLYLEVADTFEKYIQARWSMSRDWAYKQIAAYEAADDVKGLEVEIPSEEGKSMYTMVYIDNERQARELAKLETMQERADVVSRAAAASRVVDGKVILTAAGIKKAAAAKPAKKKKAAKKAAAKTEEPTGRQWCGHQAKQLERIAVDADSWKQKHAKGDSRWLTILQNLDAAHKAFKVLARK